MRALIATIAAVTLVATAASGQQLQPESAAAFAKAVANANAFEIQSSQLAAERAQSADVKSFAERMVKDHSKVAQDLQAALKAAKLPSSAERLDRKGKVTLVKLRNVRGVPFDRAYINAQLNGHIGAVALFRNYASNGQSPELKSFAEKTLPVLEEHLAMVEKLNAQGVARSGAKGSGGRALSPSGAPPPKKQEP